MQKCLLIAVLVLVFFHLLPFIQAISNLKAVDRVIAEDIAISAQWSEIKLARPMSASHRAQLISLDLPQDVVAIPEVQLVGQNGETFKLEPGKATNSGNSVVILFDLNKGLGLTKDRTYGVVRVRSDARVQCHKITWHSQM